MQDRTLRTIGASVVLIGIGIAGVVQISSTEGPPPAEIVATESSTTRALDRMDGSSAPSTTQAEPFTYRLGVLSGISTDNFWAYYGDQPSVWNSYVLGPTKPSLFSLDRSTGTLTPELAAGEATPTWDENGWRVRVPLSDGLRWSDGAPVTAHDLVFTFETVRRLGLAGSWADSYPATIESVHADSDYELRIEFSERPNLAAWPQGIGLAPVLAQHVWSDAVQEEATAADLYAMSGDIDVSGGPLTLVSATDTLVVSNANPGYPAGDIPDTVEYHVYDTEEALVAAVGDGSVDAMLTPNGVTREQLATIEDDESVSVLHSPANGIRYLGFNLNREPMSKMAFRAALALLLDRDDMATQIPHTGPVAWSMLPSANGRWFDPDAAEVNRERYAGELPARLEQALTGLREAGYAWATEPRVADGGLVAGEGLTIEGREPQPLTILTPGDAYDPARPEYVQRIADTLAVLGFDARPVETDFDSVVDLAFTPGDDGALHYDMYLLGWTLGNPALPGFYRPLFAADGAMNNTGYASKKFDAALRRYEHAYTTEDARGALWAMEQTLAADLPYLTLYTSRLTEIYRSDRVAFDVTGSLGGLQARLGGVGDVRPIDD